MITSNITIGDVFVQYYIEADTLIPENVRTVDITITGVEPDGIYTTAELEKMILAELEKRKHEPREE